MGEWLKKPDNLNVKVYLSGNMARLDFDDKDKNFFFELAVKSQDDGKLDNVLISKAVAANKERKQAGSPARALTCFHETKPSINIAVFYRRLSSTQIVLIGYGNHIGTDNLNYSVQWADGSTTSIYLKAKVKEAESFLQYPKRIA
jgi:hypothetical protein